jgi:hypothetical protein
MMREREPSFINADFPLLLVSPALLLCHVSFDRLVMHD